MEVSYNVIGFFKCDEKHRFETPRQGVLANNSGVVELNAGYNFEQAIVDLEGFERIWLIYDFHLNTTWKPKVTPPRSLDNKKKGVFATRSPHRPNSIGMSCVELVKVEGRKIHIKNFDLLHNTPIIDIKPYIPYCDSFPDSKTGWLPMDSQPTHKCVFSKLFKEQASFIHEAYGLNLINFTKLQLSNNPLCGKRKRIYITNEETGEYQLGCRTWRINFTILDDIVNVNSIISSYNTDELEEGTADKYQDKHVHRAFLKRFSPCDITKIQKSN